MRLVLSCVSLVEILDKLYCGLVSVDQKVWKRKKNGADC